MKKVRGTVKFFDAKKGYGFIIVPGLNEDVFVYHTQILQEGFRVLFQGEEVRLFVIKAAKGLQAAQVERSPVYVPQEQISA